MAEKNDAWIELTKVVCRTGVKAPWVEMIVTTASGKQVKMIARKVDRFLSERDSVEELQ